MPGERTGEMVKRPTRPDEPLVGRLAGRAIEVRGEDRIGYLDNVLSQRLADLAPGQVCGALELEVHGTPTAMLDVAALDDRLLLVVPDEDVAVAVVDGLGARTFLADATFVPRDEDRILRVCGQGADAAADGAGLPAEPGGVAVHDGVVVVGREEAVDLIVPDSELAGWHDRLVDAGATPVGEQELDAWRIAAGMPAWGSEVAAPHLPEETGLLPTHVHLDKGCYPGQEAVARMWMLGRPRRRLAAVDLQGDADTAWQTGSGRSAVEVTSAASYAGSRVGLAYVPADADEGDAYLEDGSGVVVRRIVGAGRPVPGHDPAMKRRRDSRR